MAIDNRLQVFNEEGQSVDYDILASDVKFLPDGKDLPTKLAEMEAHQGDGTVTGVKVGSTPYDPDSNGVVDLSIPFNAKVDKVDGKGLSKNDYTDADKAKVDSLKTVATSGSYNDLTDKPVIPEGATPDQSLDPNSDNAVSNAAVCAGLSSKANSSDLANYATKSELTSGLSVKQNTLTFDDTPGDTDNPVKSRGIKQAIDFVTPTISSDGKWIIGGELTQHVAQGPAGNTQILDPTTFDPATQIINNVADGGDTDVLSAEMGKVIVQNLYAIYDALAPYCFAGERPILSWGSTIFRYRIDTYGVTGGIDITDIEVDGVPAQAMPNAVLRGASLSFKLELPDDLYIFDDGLSIMMGGIEHANNANVFNKATGEVTLTVIGNVTIVANALTYVGYNDPNDDRLQLFLDGRNRGGVAGHWTSLVNYNGTPIDFALTNCDETHDDYVGFNPSEHSKGVGSIALLDVPASAATTEVALSGLTTTDSDTCCVLHNNIGSNNRVALSFVGVSNGIRNTNISTSPFDNAPGVIELPQSKWGSFYLSVMSGSGKINGEDMNISTAGSQIANANSYLALFMRYVDTSSNQYAYSKGNLHSLRVYSRHLTDLERAQNLKVDRKRFNLGY